MPSWPVQWVADPNNEALKANAKLLFETCLMESGFILDDVKAHNERVLQLLGTDMGVTDLTPVEEEEYPEVVEPEGEDKKEGIPGLEGLDLEGMGLGSGMGDDLNLGIDVKNKGNVDQATIDELLSQVRKKQLDDAEEKALKDEL